MATYYRDAQLYGWHYKPQLELFQVKNANDTLLNSYYQAMCGMYSTKFSILWISPRAEYSVTCHQVAYSVTHHWAMCSMI